jgi:hypothetical protein
MVFSEEISEGKRGWNGQPYFISPLLGSILKDS